MCAVGLNVVFPFAVFVFPAIFLCICFVNIFIHSFSKIFFICETTVWFQLQILDQKCALTIYANNVNNNDRTRFDDTTSQLVVMIIYNNNSFPEHRKMQCFLKVRMVNCKNKNVYIVSDGNMEFVVQKKIHNFKSVFVKTIIVYPT